MAKSVRISYLERKKILKIPEAKNNTDLDFLAEQFKKEFGLESDVSVIFQRFDDDWEENIDLDAESVINDKDKLNALVLNIPSTTMIKDKDKVLCIS